MIFFHASPVVPHLCDSSWGGWSTAEFFFFVDSLSTMLWEHQLEAAIGILELSQIVGVWKGRLFVIVSFFLSRSSRRWISWFRDRHHAWKSRQYPALFVDCHGNRRCTELVNQATSAEVVSGSRIDGHPNRLKSDDTGQPHDRNEEILSLVILDGNLVWTIYG